MPCCPPFSAPCYHFEETEPVAFLFRKCCLPCLGLLYKKQTQLNVASPDQRRVVGTGSADGMCPWAAGDQEAPGPFFRMAGLPPLGPL